ncbi:MAG: hypothetical protein EOQ97_26660 [Mesorhizobium sp.]|nr:MAG: hypothetical protein EOQ97_26660 [Mesorhizobium sp.]
MSICSSLLTARHGFHRQTGGRLSASDDYPSGYALNLTDGIARLRLAADCEAETFSRPGEVVRLRIVVPPVANRFMPGHRDQAGCLIERFPQVRHQYEHRGS